RIRLERRPPLAPPGLAPVEHGADRRSEGPCRRDLLRGVAPVGDALVELLLVLEAPGLAGRYPDVELEVLRVVADGGAPKRLFEIEVPADEAALGAVPEVPDRVGLAGTSQDQHAVATPVPTPCPGMRATVG